MLVRLLSRPVSAQISSFHAETDQPFFSKESRAHSIIMHMADCMTSLFGSNAHALKIVGMSESALKSLVLKEEFLADFIQRCSIKEDCVFQGLRITYDYTKNEQIDAVIITSKQIHIFEIVTWSGRYRKESDNFWIREEKVDSSTINQTVPSNNDTNSNSLVTIMTTKVTNPVIDGLRKVKALVQYMESKLGPRCLANISFHVLFVKEECALSEDCLADSRIVSYSQLNYFTDVFRTGWGRWFLEWYPMWPVWLRRYTELKNTLKTIPLWDMIYLKSGSKLYGELKSCHGVPYDRQTTSEISFTTTKAGYLIGRDGIKAKGIKRNSSTQLDEVPLDSVIEFKCVDADTPTIIKLTDVDKLIISRPL